MRERLRVVLEVVDKKAFASAADWPGWSRSGKTREAAIEALLAYADRYRPVVEEAGQTLSRIDAGSVEVVDEVEGSSGTTFGVPSHVSEADRQPLSRAEAERRAAIVEAAWTTFDRIAANAPEGLRKGPRGGGRDRTKIVEHVMGADGAYAREMGLDVRYREPPDAAAYPATRAAMLDALRQPTDGSALAGRRWTTRYAAHRIAWHALDHAWEIEDRSGAA